jgi:hypothetical protein
MTAGLVADPGVDRCGDVWLGEDFGSDSVLSCGVCIGCESEDMVLDEEASVDFVRLLDLYASIRVSSAFDMASKRFTARCGHEIDIPLWLSDATAPPYSSGDLFRLVPRELGCESKFGAMVEAASPD